MILLEIQIENEEAVLFTVNPIAATEKQDLEQNVQWRMKSISVETNHKDPSSKAKGIQSSKSLPESNQIRATKTRRQTVKRTVQIFVCDSCKLDQCRF